MIYFVIGFYLLFLAFKYDVYGSKNESAKKFHYYLALIILILLAALRYRIGGDTCRYMDLYGADLSFEADLGGRFQPLWRLLTDTLYSISPDFTLFQFVHAIFLNVVIFSFFRKYSPWVFVCIFLYYLKPYLYINTEIIRQSFAIAIFLLSVQACIKRKWWLYYLYILVAFLFHSGAILLVIVPFLYGRKINAKTIAGICACIIALGVFSYWAPRTGIFFIDNLLHQGLTYNENWDDFSTLARIRIFTVQLLVPIAIYMSGRRWLFRESPLSGFFLFILLVMAVSACLPQYFRFYDFVVIFAVTICSEIFSRLRALKRVYIPVWMTLMVLYQIGFYQSAEYMGYHFYNRYYPYYSVLNPRLSPEREAIIYSENNKWIYYNYN